MTLQHRSLTAVEPGCSTSQHTSAAKWRRAREDPTLCSAPGSTPAACDVSTHVMRRMPRPGRPGCGVPVVRCPGFLAQASRVQAPRRSLGPLRALPRRPVCRKSDLSSRISVSRCEPGAPPPHDPRLIDVLPVRELVNPCRPDPRPRPRPCPARAFCAHPRPLGPKAGLRAWPAARYPAAEAFMAFLNSRTFASETGSTTSATERKDPCFP